MKTRDTFKVLAVLTALPMAAAADPIKVGADTHLNCRTGPGTGYPVATVLAPGSEHSSIETYSGWSKINANGKRCWASASPAKPKAKRKPARKHAAPKVHPRVVYKVGVYYNQSVKNPQYSVARLPVYSSHGTDVGYGYHYPNY